MTSILIALAMFFGLGATVPAVDEISQTGMVDCPFEVSTNCYWDAERLGNGEGESFVDVNGKAYYACEAEDTKDCFWDAAKQGNSDGRSFTDVNGVALFWDEIGTSTGAWDTYGAIEGGTFVTEGSKVTYEGLWKGEMVSKNRLEVGGYLFNIS